MRHPWSSNWDLLYIGHCGDYFGALGDGVGVGHRPPEHATKIPYAVAADRTIPWRTNPDSFTAGLFTAFQIPEQTRLTSVAMATLIRLATLSGGEPPND